MHTAAHTGLLLLGLALAGCASPPVPPPVAVNTDKEKTPAQPQIEWKRLDAWQGVMTAAAWRTALNERYAPHDAAKGFLEVTTPALDILKHDKGPKEYFALGNRAPDAPLPAPTPGARYWRTRGELDPATTEKPLAGLRVALDPGHLGGEFAEMEQRSFSVDGRPPVREGDMTLRVAQILKPRLEALGANVSLVRRRPGSVMDAGNVTLAMSQAASMAAATLVGGNLTSAEQGHINAFFYRDIEIQKRAEIVNDRLRPDLVLCLHLNAAEWPDPQKPALVPGPQHFHILVNGAYSATELASDTARFALVQRVASGAGAEELAAARAMAEAAAPIFGLPAFKYSGTNAVALGGNGYVWGRNLLANRLYDCPVVYLEPYVMNSVEGYERAQAGEYAGTRVFNGVARKNIYDEYADAVVAGLVKYYGAR